MGRQGLLAAHWSAERHPLQRPSLRQARASVDVGRECLKTAVYRAYAAIRGRRLSGRVLDMRGAVPCVENDRGRDLLFLREFSRMQESTHPQQAVCLKFDDGNAQERATGRYLDGFLG
jgi:hypothetical protein